MSISPEFLFSVMYRLIWPIYLRLALLQFQKLNKSKQRCRKHPATRTTVGGAGTAATYLRKFYLSGRIESIYHITGSGAVAKYDKMRIACGGSNLNRHPKLTFMNY